MARPSTPLIDRDVAVATALDLIDEHGLEALSVRRLAAALGVSAASLYHHFRDKQEILDRVRMRIALESDLGAPAPDGTWQDHVRAATNAYRALLLSHPNMAPLMHPNAQDRPFALRMREPVVATMFAAGLPDHLVHPIVDSVELLAYASAVLDPDQRPAVERIEITDADGVPALARAVAAAPATAQETFDLQLDALLTGWTELVGRPS